MIYIIGDDSGGDQGNYFVSYMIESDGVPFLCDMINKAIERISSIVGGFERFHFRELLNDFKLTGPDKKETFSITEGTLLNTKEGVLEGVTDMFIAVFEELIEKEYIYPYIAVARWDNDSWKKTFEKNLLSVVTNTKKKETLLPLLCVNKCINYLRSKGINEDLYCLADLSGNSSKTIIYDNPHSERGQTKIHFRSSVGCPLLQMADFLAYSFNRMQTQGSDDMFNKHTTSLQKYYQE